MSGASNALSQDVAPARRCEACGPVPVRGKDTCRLRRRKHLQLHHKHGAHMYSCMGAHAHSRACNGATIPTANTRTHRAHSFWHCRATGGFHPFPNLSRLPRLNPSTPPMSALARNYLLCAVLVDGLIL
jgi:hypothetical protein